MSHEREKLINAIVFFAQNTQHCGKIKLIKLLYLADFAHYRETGRSITGLEYRAWKMGPVPIELFEEWDALGPDMAQALEIVPTPVVDYVREEVRPKRAFDDGRFTRRELRIMQDLATRFRDDLSRPMVNITHQERGPWNVIWDGGRGYHERIPYRLAVQDDDIQRDAVLEATDEHQGLIAALGKAH
jgi:uncharacterized phage-associated protein